MLSFKQIAILLNHQTNSRKKCKVCGHGRLLGKRDKVICTHCGHYIFKDDTTEFNYRLNESMIKANKNENLTN